MAFNWDEWRDQIKKAKSGQEIYDLVMKLPDRTHIEIACERGYKGKDAKYYADMLDWDDKIDQSASIKDRFNQIDQIPDTVKHILVSFRHP